MNDAEQEAIDSIKTQIIERLQEEATAMARAAGMFFGWNNTRLDYAKVVQHCLKVTLTELDGKPSIFITGGDDNDFFLKHLRSLDRDGTQSFSKSLIHNFSQSATQTCGMLVGAIFTASKLGRGQAAAINGDNALSFPSLLDIGMAVNALTPDQGKKIDLSALGKGI